MNREAYFHSSGDFQQAVAARERFVDQPAVACLSVLAAFAVVQLTLAAGNFSMGEDSTWYLTNIAQGKPQFHPNHLLFEWIYAGTGWLLAAAGFSFPPATAAAVTTSAASLAALALVYAIVLESTGRQVAALWAMIATGSCFAFWHYSTLCETYVMPLAFVLMTLRLVQSGLWSGAPGWRLAVATALCASLATLTHQMFCFFQAMVGLTWLIVELRGRRLPSGTLVYAALSVLAVGLAYVMAWKASSSGVPFQAWAVGHAAGGLWDPPSLMSPVKAAVGLGTAVLSPQALLFFEPTREISLSLIPGKGLVEELFLARQGLSAPAAALSLAAIAVFIFSAALVLVSVVAGRARRAGNAGGRGFQVLLVSHLTLYAGLITIWEPLNIEFWLHLTALAAILLAINANWIVPRFQRVAWTMVAALFMANLVSAIQPLSKKDADYWHAANRELLERARPGDVVVTDCGYVCHGYLQYFTGATVVPASRADFGGFLALLAANPDGRLLVSSWAFDPPLSQPADQPRADGGFASALQAWLGGTVAGGAAGEQVIRVLPIGSPMADPGPTETWTIRAAPGA